MSAADMETTVVGWTINRIQAGEVLERAELARALLPVLNAGFAGADVAWGALMGALQARGPTAGEVLGLVDAIVEFDPALGTQLAAPIDLGVDARTVTIAGSGKETFKTFNISTAAAFVAAAHPDVCVVKPAGRATSAITGASDVLHALGVRAPRTLTDVREMAQRSGIGVFDYHLVAPRYGPRYEGRFHHLHPLSHVTPWLFVPIRTDGVVFGVADPRVELAAQTMAAVGVPAAAVVSTDVGDAGRIDELAPFGITDLAFLSNDTIGQHTVERVVPDNLAAVAQRPTTQANVEILVDVLHTRASDLALRLVTENAALILRVAGVVEDLDSGRDIAGDLLASGEAVARLHACREASWEDR